MEIEEQEIICVGCPLGCRIEASISGDGKVSVIGGNQCKKWLKYALDEIKSPVRILTTTLLVEGAGRPLPVRSSKPVPKSMVKDCVQALAKIRVKTPVKIGQVIVPNVCGTEADLISSSNL